MEGYMTNYDYVSFLCTCYLSFSENDYVAHIFEAYQMKSLPPENDAAFFDIIYDIIKLCEINNMELSQSTISILYNKLLEGSSGIDTNNTENDSNTLLGQLPNTYLSIFKILRLIAHQESYLNTEIPPLLTFLERLITSHMFTSFPTESTSLIAIMGLIDLYINNIFKIIGEVEKKKQELLQFFLSIPLYLCIDNCIPDSLYKLIPYLLSKTDIYNLLSYPVDDSLLIELCFAAIYGI
ncbi:hypothetical protein WA158_000380 [Blastocystis sp. Blastoise]